VQIYLKYGIKVASNLVGKKYISVNNYAFEDIKNERCSRAK
jgi:hypothetical protein